MNRTEIKRKSLIQQTGVVVIGRNEGERLRLCFNSLEGYKCQIVYVDSGSTDNSVLLAHNFGAEVIKLNDTKPFSAARARNEGIDRILEIDSKIKYVQCIDGDCELFDGWLDSASSALEENENIAIVCGLLHEKSPQVSIYNRICDMEWSKDIGQVSACGGIFMTRVSDFLLVNGFNSSLIAGEEPELCSRLYKNNLKVIRLETDMAFHDSNMTKFSQWWTKGIRNGYGGVELMLFQKNVFRQIISISFWGGFWLFILLLVLTTNSFLPLILLIFYPLKVINIARKSSHLDKRIGDPWLYASHCIFSKIPGFVGQMKFLFSRLLNKPSKVISHK